VIKKIFLIGLPGSGKTTLGKQLAALLKLPFVDLDRAIEKSAGMTVEEIFKASGEAGFRQLEADELTLLCDRTDSFVMATGGGAPCFHNNLSLMKKEGFVIFLDVPPKTISERISSKNGNRPLLKHETPDSMKDRIEFLRSQRISFYKQANVTVSGSEISAEEILKACELKS
jgi:shikimate kinase